MVEWGGKIADVSVDELQARLADEDDGKAVKRLFTAIEYKHGLSPARIEAKYGISKDNVYTWLDRLEERGLDEAIHDDPKPGKEPVLSTEDQERLRAVLRESPSEVGYDARTWDAALLQRYIEDELGVEYSRRHVRRLMKQAELSSSDRSRTDVTPGE